MTQMKTLLVPAYYYSEEIFKREQTELFGATWQFAGFTIDVAEPDAMFAVTIAGKSVVIKNFEGKLKAFHNVCSHRFSRICTEKTRGPLQCPYHGWTYNEAGVPYAIPKRKQFTAIDPEQLKLKPYELAVCGKFIFVKEQLGGPSLEEYLGEAQELLKKISEALGLLLDRNEMIIAANWKIVVENTLEEYHVREVHPQSLYNVGIKNVESVAKGLHSSSLMQFETQLHKHKKLAEVYATRPWQVEDYIHQLIFPNLTLASAFGTTISIQHITSLSATTTCFVSYVFATTLAREALASPVVKAFNKSAVDFNRQVFTEDKIICEQVQKGIMEAISQEGPLCSDEKRVFAFQETYARYLKENNL